MVWSKRIAISILLFVTAAVAGHGLHDKLAGANSSPSGYATVNVPNVTLGAASAPARLSSDSVLPIVEQKLRPSLFTHPYTIAYGSFDESDISLRLNGPDSPLQPLGVRNVWKVTVTGLDIGRPCGAPGRSGRPNCPPPTTTLAIFVDDQTGQVLDSIGW